MTGVVQAEPSVKWTFPLKASAHAPTLYPDCRKPTALIIAAGRGVIHLDGKGKAVWTATQDADIATPAGVADLDGDGSAEIVFALSTGHVVCLNAEGRRRWRFSHEAPVSGFNSVTLADLLPEPGLEVLIGYEDGWLYCLSSRGEQRWRFHGDRFRTGPAAVADVDGDGTPEIVYGTDNGHVYCLSGWGMVKWRYAEFAPYGRSGPNLADLDGDGKAEVLITRSCSGNATCLMALDGTTGTFKWRTSDLMQSYVSNACVDLDGDGRLEVLHADKGNHVYCTSHDGTLRWRADLAGHGIFWAPAVADMDGDGRLDAVFGARGVDPETGACAYVLSDQGKIKERMKLGSGANAGPAVADIDGDGQLEVILATEGPGKVQCLTWHGKGVVAWPSLRGDSSMTGATNLPPGKPAGPQSFSTCGDVQTPPHVITWGENTSTFTWKDPAPEDAFIEFSVRTPAGLGETRITDLKPQSKQASVTWELSMSSPATATVRLLDPQGRSRFVRTEELRPQPPEYCRFDEVRRTVEAAGDVAKKTNADAAALRARLYLLEASIDAVNHLTPAAGGDPGQQTADAATRLRRQADVLMATANVLARFWQDGGSGTFVVWQDQNPWDEEKGDGSLLRETVDAPSGKKAPVPFSLPRVKVSAYGDEFEDVALNLLNVTAEPIDVRCTFVKPILTGARAGRPPELVRNITLRRAIRAPSQFHGMVNDALPRLDASGVITLVPGETRQLWLVVDTHGLKPGTHQVVLYLGTMSEKPAFREVPIEIEVWPIRLPKVYAQMNWSSVDPTTVPDQVLRDMLDHGVSVFYGPSATVPVDAAGNPAGPVDWQTFDATLQRLPSYAQVLFSGPPARAWPAGPSPKSQSPQDVAGFKAAVRVLAAHMNAIGWGYDRWAFYPVDEPWLTGDTQIPYLRQFCKAVKSADPKARIYADPAGFVRVDSIAEFADLIDIWQPEMNLLKRDPELVKWFQQHARTFWAYEAPGPSKDLLPLGHYRAFAWLAWQFGTQGAGYWVYRDVDLWWPGTGDYGAVYPADDGVVPSRRWEASRDGVEDYRAFYVLSQEIAGARKSGRAADADRAQALMDEAVQNVVGWQVGRIDEITRMTRDYELDFRLLSEYRSRIAGEVMSLRGR